MQGENLSRKLVSSTKYDCYPGEDDSDEDDMDAMGQSFDIQSGIETDFRFYIGQPCFVTVLFLILSLFLQTWILAPTELDLIQLLG